MWAIVGHFLGTISTPRNCTQYKEWICRWLPNGQAVHHFGFAAVCWAIWKCRNKAVFDAKIIRHPAEILLHSCSFMNPWACLYSSDFQGRLSEGVKGLMACAYKILVQQSEDPHTWLFLPAPEDHEEEEE